MQERRRWFVITALVLALALFTAACGGEDGGGEDTTQNEDGGQASEGGTLLVETDGFGWSNGFDPTGEYWGVAWGYYSLTSRALMGYRHVPGAEGNEPIPDLAEGEPEISEDGKTYTFTIRDGVQFGPPVNREVTSKDVEYAFRRIATEALAAQYGSYYFGVIEGLEAGKDPGAGGIPGIETPDDKTIVFKLTEETPDFLYRLAMPATQPIPEEVGKCFDKPGEYGRYLVSSGPYMIEGADATDSAACNELKPYSGFNPDDHLYLVRNPNYDEESEAEEARLNLFDEMRIDLNTNAKNIWDKITAGEIHAYTGSSPPPPEVIREYSTDDELKDRLKVNPDDRTWYITMNLTEPPFDDIHVRKAANLVMDKDGLRRAWGGEISGEIATHIQPPALTGGTPTAEEYDPYPSEGGAGDEEAAKEEMKQSKYDSDGDGVCDDPVCDNVIMINRNVAPWTEMEPVVVESLKKIGINISPRPQTPDAAYTTIQTPAKKIPIALNPGWGKDYPDPYTFAGFLFDGRAISETGNYNYSLVGITKEKAKEVGADYVPVPSVDDKVDECLEAADEERNQCWIDLDKQLMEEVVPWVPYLWANVVTIVSEDVTSWDYDQFSGSPAWTRVGVSGGSE